MLDLDQVTEGLLTSLAEGASVLKPAPPGSAAEAKQLAALATLFSVASGAEASFLGGGWVVVLRTLSELDLLRVSGIHKLASVRNPYCSQNHVTSSSFRDDPAGPGCSDRKAAA